MGSAERYKMRKQKLKNMNSIVMVDIEQNIVNELLISRVDNKLINITTQIMEEHYKFDYDFSVSEEEAKEFLEKFKTDFNQARFDRLISDCKKDVINSIVTPFGLGHIVAAYDKTGGNVDTIHNVRNKDKSGIGLREEESKKDGLGVYATEEAKTNHVNRGAYDSNEYHKDPNFIAINRAYSEARKNGNAVDYMTGVKLDSNQSHDLDHIKSAKEIHDDAGRVLAEIDGSTLANTDTNLASTTAGSNRTKKADSMEDFLAKKNERLKKIDDLKNKDSLSPQEQNELRKMEELSKIDDKMAMEADDKARKEIDKEINKTYYTSGKFAKNTAKTSATEGAKMGMQQAIGLVMTEFFTTLFDEIYDIYKNGFSNGFDDDRFLIVLKERLLRIANKLKAKWKDVAIAFKDGFIAGFISNLVTTAINMFVTTGKRLIRIIREGIFSIFKAVKILIFPPENLTYEEAMHEAKKLIASGLIVGLGVLIEEAISQFLHSMVVLIPFADTLSAIFVGAITGLAITMTAYYLDKKKNDKDAIKELINQAETKFDNVEQMLKLLAY